MYHPTQVSFTERCLKKESFSSFSPAPALFRLNAEALISPVLFSKRNLKLHSGGRNRGFDLVASGLKTKGCNKTGYRGCLFGRLAS